MWGCDEIAGELTNALIHHVCTCTWAINLVSDHYNREVVSIVRQVSVIILLHVYDYNTLSNTMYCAILFVVAS